MKKAFKTRGWLIPVLAAALLLFPPPPCSAGLFDSLTIEKEKQLGEEFLLQIQQYYELSTDPFLTSYINRLGQKLVAQLGAQPYRFRFFIIHEDTMNAFAVPGGYVFVNTGLIRMTEREGELAGVMAHEISHIYARHMAKQMDKAKITNIATLIGALASIFLGGAGAPVLMGSMAAGQSAMLKYSRDCEREADELGFKWMVKAGYNPRDMVSIFKKMSKQRWFEGGKVPIYLSTHPDVDNRIVDLGYMLARYQGPLPTEHDNPVYRYFTVKLDATYGNSFQLMRRMTQDGLREPQNALYPYGRALALDKLEKYDEATATFQQALKLAPENPLIQRDLAIHYFNMNRYPEAQKIFEDLSRRYPRDDVALYYQGRICQERKQIDQALPLFEKVHALNPTFNEVFLNLGTLYGEKGNLGPAHYYLGLYSLRARALPSALFHFRKALVNLSPADPRYIEVKRQVARLEKMRVKITN